MLHDEDYTYNIKFIVCVYGKHLQVFVRIIL